MGFTIVQKTVCSMAMSGAIKQLKKKKKKVLWCEDPKREVILFGNTLGILQVEIPYCFVVFAFHLPV